MSIQPISFGATTKKGNHYKKTHIGTVAGALAGATAIAIEARALKNAKIPVSSLRPIINKMYNLQKNGLGRDIARKITKASAKTGFYSGIASIGLVCLAAGAGINKIINAIKAKKADKIA